MLCAANRQFSKTFIGDFTFDVERERTRCPLFLNRNIMLVLDHHAKRRRHPTRSSARPSQNGAPTQNVQANLVTPPPRSTRLRDQLIEKFHQADAELIFDVRSIRRKLNYRENLDERPRKRVKREAVQCRCYLAVWDNREGHRQLEPILKRSEDCVVLPADTASDAHAAQIELESPFRVPAREFFVPIVDGNGEFSKWAIGDRYLLEIKIIPCNRSELWPPMPILSKSEESLTRDLVRKKDIAFTDGMLISNYTNLPHTPPVGVPLNVAFDQGGRTFKTKYGLEINAEWTYPHVYEAKLKKENQILAKQIEEEERSDPLCRSIGRQSAKIRRAKPSEPSINQAIKPNVNVCYVWDIKTKTPVPRESRTISLGGLHCPVCHIREFANLERLQFHFCNSHDKYRFILEHQEGDPETQKLRCAVFRVEVADIVRPCAANQARDEQEFSWQKPGRAFDINSYVSGEQSWVGALPRRRTPVATQTQPLSVITTHSQPSQTQAVEPKGLFRPAGEVREIQLPVRKKFQVPVARTRKKTSFYRSINHRAMETGEILSETDDDVDNDWLIKRHHDAISETNGLTKAEKSFRQRWNAHVISEGSPSGRYVSDLLIRFALSNAAWLQDKDDDVDMFVQFQDLAGTLMGRGLIDGRVLKDCFRIIRGGRNRSEANTANPTPDPPDMSLRVPAVVKEVSNSSRGPNLHTPFSQVHEVLVEKHRSNDEESIAAPLQTLKGIDGLAHEKGEQEKAAWTELSGSRSGTPTLPQQSPRRPEPKTVLRSPADGFCGLCAKYIQRPKRNAITCSNLVSPLCPFYFG
jgi:VEFS-Box of polycomb protein